MKDTGGEVRRTAHQRLGNVSRGISFLEYKQNVSSRGHEHK